MIDYNKIEMTQKVNISPDMAIKILTNNKTNRTLRKQIIQSYAEQMSNGRWRENNPHAIIISEKGVLLDGQHRLSAVVLSGKTLSWNVYIVKRQYTNHLDLMVDVGVRRSTADIIGLDIHITAVINRLLKNANYGSHVSNPDIQEIQNFYNEFLKDDEEICELLRKIRKPIWSLASYKSVALAYYLMEPDIQNYVKYMIEKIIDKDMEDKPQILLKIMMSEYETKKDISGQIKLAMTLFHPKYKSYKIAKQQQTSIAQFFRKCLDTIGYSDYYKRKNEYHNLYWRNTRGKDLQ